MAWVKCHILNTNYEEMLKSDSWGLIDQLKAARSWQASHKFSDD